MKSLQFDEKKKNQQYSNRYPISMLFGVLILSIIFGNNNALGTENPIDLRLYPAEFGRVNTVPVVPNAPNFIRIVLIGDRHKVKEPVKIVLDVPAKIGDFGLLGGGTVFNRNGTKFRRFIIDVPKHLINSMRLSPASSIITIWFDAKKLSGDGVMYYRAIIGQQEQKEKSVKIKLLDSMPTGPVPKQFKILFVWGTFTDVPQVLRSDVYKLLRQIGINTFLLTSEHLNTFTEYVVQRARSEGCYLWANIPIEYVKFTQDPQQEMVIWNKGNKAFAIDRGYNKRVIPNVEALFWDWEPQNARQNPKWDDKPTIEAFAKEMGLDVKTLTPETLKSKYRKEWLAFRSKQIANVVKSWAKYVRSIDPNITLAIGQGSGWPVDVHVDYKLYDDIPNIIHLPMVYTSSATSLVKNTVNLRKYLPKSKIMPFVTSGMVINKGWFASVNPRTLYLQFTASALLGCVGCGHWPDVQRGMDMEYLREISLAAHDIASVESFLFGGKANPEGITIEPLPEASAFINTAKGKIKLISPPWDKYTLKVAYQRGKSIMVGLINFYKKSPAVVRVRIAKPFATEMFVYDPVTHIALVPDNGQKWDDTSLKKGILYEVPAQKAGMLVIAPKLPKGGFNGTVKESDVRKQFDKRCQTRAKSADLVAMKKGELTITWADVNRDGSPDIVISNSKQQLGIGTSGNLISWKLTGVDKDFVSLFDGGGACIDQFWWPKSARSSDDKNSEYELISREIKNGRATVVMRHALTHPDISGLVLEKKYSITADSPKIKITVTIKNESPDPMEFSYWSHNCLNTGGTPILTIQIGKGEKVIDDTEKVKNRIFARSDLPKEQLKILPFSADTPEKEKQLLNKILKNTITGSQFILGKPSSRKIIINVDYNELLELFRWWDTTDRGRYTVEWIYQKRKIVTGQSWTTSFSLEAVSGK